MNKPETEIAGRYANRTTAGARIAHKVRHVGPVAALDDANSAIDRRRGGFAAGIQYATHEAGVGPFPDIACHIKETVLVRTETADGLRLPVDSPSATARLHIIDRKGAQAWIAIISGVRQNIILEPAGGRNDPLLVGWQAEADPRRPRQPGRISMSVPPTDVDCRAIGSSRFVIDRRTCAGHDTTAVVCGRDLVSHDSECPLDSNCRDRPARWVSLARGVATGPMAARGWPQVHRIRTRTVRCGRPRITDRCESRDRQGRDDCGDQGLDFPSKQHGKPFRGAVRSEADRIFTWRRLVSGPGPESRSVRVPSPESSGRCSNCPPP